MGAKYKSWIPTATCRLSFRIVGQSIGKSPSIWANVVQKERRFVIAFQKRNLSDSLFRLGPTFFNEEGNFWFCCVASVDEAGGPDTPLVGTISVFTRNRWKGANERFVNRAIDLLRRSSDPQQAEGLEDYVAARHKRVGRLVTDECLAFASFTLQRNGELELSSVHIAEDARSGVEDVDVLASQLFFFLKDITHKHQHHHDSTDTIIGLYHATDDLTWRRKVLFALYYQITDLRRWKDERRYGNALGMLAYAKAFVVASETKGPLPFFFNDGIEASLHAAQDNERSNNAEISKRSDSERNLIIFFIGTSLSLLGLAIAFEDKFQDASPSSSFIRIVRYVYVNIDLALAIVIITSVLLAIYRRLPFDWRSWPLIRDYVRAVHIFPKHVSVLTTRILAVVTLYLTYLSVTTILKML